MTRNSHRESDELEFQPDYRRALHLLEFRASQSTVLVIAVVALSNGESFLQSPICVRVLLLA